MLLRSVGRWVACHFLLAVAAGVAAPASAASPARPNIVFILADDLGWKDLRSDGHAWHETPNLDRLARQGTRFTRGYAAAPICSAGKSVV